jgi:hypothetical protein
MIIIQQSYDNQLKSSYSTIAKDLTSILRSSYNQNDQNPFYITAKIFDHLMIKILFPKTVKDLTIIL